MNTQTEIIRGLKSFTTLLSNVKAKQCRRVMDLTKELVESKRETLECFGS